ncbi:LysR family transcriptional regulator [Paraburkholderia saeva]|uniref:HTH-type transcriptional activator CmpR n=1 Tax=Paraburkholderia saeva TaxID=2777537 RepID=A0A9N8S202_9BURK|nr:LysR family transcriptional regulator [Paraburkholderia saeva]CAG4891557.1 HTH-type transcriptional activator CmpR [Paraburkholderia saeva]CAG4921320.1 HTH-type transcriptional activator CmpR [Paraburkholderia saeva]
MLKTATFRQLKALDMVSKLGSISRAAEELHLTQPAISLQIRLLEEAAGAPLVQRVGRGVQLTAAGDLLARYALEILDLWNEGVDEVAALRGELGGTLRIGAITTAEYLIPPLLVQFTEQRPHVKVTFKVGNRDDIIRMLATHEIDLAVMGSPPRELRTVATAFAKHPMAFVASPSHPLMQHRRLSLKDLESANLLVRERGAGTRATVESLFKNDGRTLHIGSELSSNEAIKQMVEAGLGIAFLSLHACALEFQAGLLALLPLSGNPVEKDWYVMHTSDKRLPQVAALFRDFLVERGASAASARRPSELTEAKRGRRASAPADPNQTRGRARTLHGER